MTEQSGNQGEAKNPAEWWEIENKAHDLRSKVDNIQHHLESQEFYDALDESLGHVARRLDDIIENSDRPIVFVVGGKSRRLTDVLLQATIPHMNHADQAEEMFRGRMRLSDRQNKGLYKFVTSDRQDQEFQLPATNASGEKITYIVFDDHQDTGKKAYDAMAFQESRGIDLMYFVTFVENPKISQDEAQSVTGREGDLSWRNENWIKYRDRVFSGSLDQTLFDGLRNLGEMISLGNDLRMNKKLGKNWDHDDSYHEIKKIDDERVQYGAVSLTEQIRRSRRLMIQFRDKILGTE